MWNAESLADSAIVTDVTDPATGHDATLTDVDQKDATCYSTGVKKHKTCSCGAVFNESGTELANEAALVIPIDENAHVWVLSTEESRPATEARGGEEVYYCSKCGKRKVETSGLIDPGISANPDIEGNQLWSVIAERDTWFRGEETLLFRSDLIKWLNDHGHGTNRVGLRIGTDRSLYDGTYYTFDFWSWDKYVEFGDKMLNGLDAGTYYLWIYDREDPDTHTNSVPFYVVDVPTLEPYSTDKHVVNSSKSLRFVASEEIDPNSVKVGSKKLYDSNDYFVSNDRKNITLSPDFLNARQTGTYNISARTKGGETIKTNFYILSTAQASSSPRTGDESQIGLWAAFLLLSGAAIVVMVPKLRKHGAK